MSSATVSRSPSPASEPDVFAISHYLIPEREHKTAGTSQLDFDGLLQTALVLHEDLQEGCGGQLWPAGMTLAKYILRQHQNSMQDKHIVEIGAGGGLVGLAVALGCNLNHSILLTDQLPMLNLMEKNISLNGLQSRASALVYDWGSQPIPQFPSSSGQPDVVLAADCVYFEPAFPLLLQTLSDLIGPETTCYFCFKKRRKADMRFIKDMKKIFDVSEIDYKDRDCDRREAIFLHQVTRRGKRVDLKAGA
jgi:protein N-lysine methyltransferase METTL21A